MRRVLAVVALVGVLAGCGASTKRETIDGVDCIVRRNAFGQPTAISCDWPDR